MTLKIKEVANLLSFSNQLAELSLLRFKVLENLNLFTTTSTFEKLSFRRASKTASLDGIPVSVKDNFCTVDFPTTCGSRMLRDFHPPYNATVVERLLNHGATLVGKNNMDEFAMGSGSTDSCFGPSKNPWSFRKEISSSMKPLRTPSSDASKHPTVLHTIMDNSLEKLDVERPWHVCGGSSGGSAGAVASGIVMAALGSDTGGSTRVPASHCGVVGLKPTYGRLSRHGLIPLVNSLDVPGILTRTIDDAALILNVLTGRDSQDSTSILPTSLDDVQLSDTPSVKGLSIGIPKEYYHPSLHPDVLDAWKWMTDAFAEAGARIVPVSLPHTRFSIVTYSVLCCCEVASNMSRYDGLRFGHRDDVMDSTEAMYARSRSFGFNDVVRGRVLAGNFFLLRRNYQRYFVKAQKVRRLITEELFQALAPGEVDLLLTPTTPAPPLTFQEFSQSDNRERSMETDIFTQAVNLAGLPAVTVPVTLSTDSGMPIGLQLIGQPFNEQIMLETGKWIESQVNFPHLPPLIAKGNEEMIRQENY